jgi:FkbM family methyltransferase
LNKFLRSSKIYNCALSDKEGMGSIRIPIIRGVHFESRSTLAQNIGEIDETGFTNIEIETTTIDNFASANNLASIGFIKIDVEGHELAVLQGGVKTLNTYQPLLLIEIEQRHHNYSIGEIFSFIEAIGYSGYYIDTVTLKIQPIRYFSVADQQRVSNFKSVSYINNFLFIPESKVSETIRKISKTLNSL